MDRIRRFLGLIAVINEEFSRHRYNFIPVNLFFLLGFAILFFVGLGGARIRLGNGGQPRLLAIAQVAQMETDIQDKYARIDGTLVPVDRIIETDGESLRSSGSADDWINPDLIWIPLVDSDGKHIILVRRENSNSESVMAEKVSMTGTIEPMGMDLHDQLLRGIGASTPAKPSIDMKHVFVQDSKRSNHPVWITVALCSGILFFAFLYTFTVHYVVFAREDRLVFPPLEAVKVSQNDVPSYGVYATGDFTLLERKLSERFLNVPASLVWMENGEVGLAANVDASHGNGFFTTDQRKGTWYIDLGLLGEEPVERGRLYHGLTVYPCLRFMTRPVGVNRDTSHRVVLATETEAERDLLIERLVRKPQAV